MIWSVLRVFPRLKGTLCVDPVKKVDYHLVILNVPVQYYERNMKLYFKEALIYLNMYITA